MAHNISFERFKRKHPTEQKCLETLLHARLPEGICANPNCGAPIALYYRPLRKKPAFLCKRCLAHVYPFAGSEFHGTHFSAKMIFEIMFLMLISRNGISSLEVSRHYDCGQKGAFRIMHVIRSLMGVDLNEPFRDCVVEVDESFLRNTGTHGMGRRGMTWGKSRENKKFSTILCISERNGRVKLIYIDSTERSSIFPELKKHIPKESLILTDNYRVYDSLVNEEYQHAFVIHKAEVNRYVDGIASTNTTEGIFSIVKRSLKGAQIKISRKYLPNYLYEICFRLNNRKDDDYGFSKLIHSMPSLAEYYKEKFNNKLIYKYA